MKGHMCDWVTTHKMANEKQLKILNARIAELEAEVASLKGTGRKRIDKMSDVVVDSNPYR